MNGELAQLVALAAHGNTFLTGVVADAPDLAGTASFKYVRSVEFGDGGAAITSTTAWFEALGADGATRLGVAAAPMDRRLVAFANAGRWWLVASLPRERRSWRAEWTVTEPRASDHNIWSIEYRVFDPPSVDTAPSVPTARAQLERALADVTAFCAVNQTGWKREFDAATQLLSSPTPKIPFFGDVLPSSGYSLAARQLLAGATKADLFGGMGSWNDLQFREPEPKQEYETVSTQLFGAIVDAVVAATNSFDASTQ